MLFRTSRIEDTLSKSSLEVEKELAFKTYDCVVSARACLDKMAF